MRTWRQYFFCVIFCSGFALLLRSGLYRLASTIPWTLLTSCQSGGMILLCLFLHIPGIELYARCSLWALLPNFWGVRLWTVDARISISRLCVIWSLWPACVGSTILSIICVLYPRTPKAYSIYFPSTRANSPQSTASSHRASHRRQPQSTIHHIWMKTNFPSVSPAQYRVAYPIM